MNHLMRDLAPDQRRGVVADRRRGHSFAQALPRRPPARRLHRPARLGALGARHRPGRRARSAARSRDVEATQRPGAAARRAPFGILVATIRAGRGRARRDRPRASSGDRREPVGRDSPRTASCSTDTAQAASRASRRRRRIARRHHRRLQRVSRARRQGGGRAPRRRRRGPVRACARQPRLHRRHRDHRARRLPGVRAPPPDPRR